MRFIGATLIVLTLCGITGAVAWWRPTASATSDGSQSRHLAECERCQGYGGIDCPELRKIRRELVDRYWQRYGKAISQ